MINFLIFLVGVLFWNMGAIILKSEHDGVEFLAAVVNLILGLILIVFSLSRFVIG